MNVNLARVVYYVCALVLGIFVWPRLGPIASDHPSLLALGLGAVYVVVTALTYGLLAAPIPGALALLDAGHLRLGLDIVVRVRRRVPYLDTALILTFALEGAVAITWHAQLGYWTILPLLAALQTPHTWWYAYRWRFKMLELEQVTQMRLAQQRG